MHHWRRVQPGLVLLHLSLCCALSMMMVEGMLRGSVSG
jgi:hypothetical protein